MPKLVMFACSHEFTSLRTTRVVIFTKYPSKSNMQGAVPFHASLFLTVVSFINLTNWDLVQLVDEKN